MPDRGSTGLRVPARALRLDCPDGSRWRRTGVEEARRRCCEGEKEGVWVGLMRASDCA